MNHAIRFPLMGAALALTLSAWSQTGPFDPEQWPTTVNPAATAAAATATADAPAGEGQVAVSSATAAEAKKVTCRTERVTGSNFRTRKVCTSPNSQDASGNWVREQQDRGAIGASAILNSAGGG